MFITTKVNTCDAFMVIQGHPQSSKRLESPDVHVPSGGQAAQSSVSSHTVNKCFQSLYLVLKLGCFCLVGLFLFLFCIFVLVVGDFAV